MTENSVSVSSASVDHAGTAVAAVGALVAVKSDAVARKADAESIIGHIHDIALRDLVEVKGFAHRALPYVITAAGALSIGLLVGHFA